MSGSNRSPLTRWVLPALVALAAANNLGTPTGYLQVIKQAVEQSGNYSVAFEKL